MIKNCYGGKNILLIVKIYLNSVIRKGANVKGLWLMVCYCLLPAEQD